MLYASRGMQAEMIKAGGYYPWSAGCSDVMQSVTSRGKALSHCTVGSLQCVMCIDCAFLACYATHRGENLHVFSPDPSFRAFPVPLRRHWVYPVKLLRLRSRGDQPRGGRSFRSLAAYCSPSAHPRNFCCSAFALNGQKYIRMRAARSAATASHPCVEVATEGIKKCGVHLSLWSAYRIP